MQEGRGVGLHGENGLSFARRTCSQLAGVLAQLYEVKMYVSSFCFLGAESEASWFSW